METPPISGAGAYILTCTVHVAWWCKCTPYIATVVVWQDHALNICTDMYILFMCLCSNEYTYLLHSTGNWRPSHPGGNIGLVLSVVCRELPSHII